MRVSEKSFAARCTLDEPRTLSLAAVRFRPSQLSFASRPSFRLLELPMFTVRQGIGLSSSFFSERDQEQQQQKPWWKQQQRSVVGFASIGAPSSGAPSAAAPLAFSFAPPLPRGKREPRTGTEFASELCHGQKKACPVLTGVGCVESFLFPTSISITTRFSPSVFPDPFSIFFRVLSFKP